MEEPKTNDYSISITIGDIQKKDAVALAERITWIIEREFEGVIGTYGMTVAHVKAYGFTHPTPGAKTLRSPRTLES